LLVDNLLKEGNLLTVDNQMMVGSQTVAAVVGSQAVVAVVDSQTGVVDSHY
jgi:hypothetical protein